MNPLEIIDEKLRRASDHISALQGEVDALLRTLPYQTVPDNDPEDLNDFEQILAKVVVPPRMCILAGEAIHQQLLDEADVAFRYLPKHGRELQVHTLSRT